MVLGIRSVETFFGFSRWVAYVHESMFEVLAPIAAHLFCFFIVFECNEFQVSSCMESHQTDAVAKHLEVH